MRSLLVVIAFGLFLADRAHAQVPNQKQIDRSIAAASRWLAVAFQTGAVSGTDVYTLGLSGICGLAMLEADVPINTPAIRNIAAFIRQSGPGTSQTYSLATSILFLDKLGYPSDRVLIQYLALRLIAGQNESGSWAYSCEWGLNEMQAAQVVRTLRNAKVDPEAPDGTIPTILNRIRETRGPAPMAMSGGDNSNTQFAIIALWVARRNGVVVDEVLARTDKYFRDSQSDAGWGYTGSGGNSPAMTCAGLISMAIGHGFKDSTLRGSNKLPSLKPDANPAPKKSIRDDKDVERGLKALGVHIKTLDTQMGSDLYYTAWSIERVGMIYGMDTIGGMPWYLPIAGLVMRQQSPNGSWPTGGHGVEASTALAILFLTRANVAGDLTNTLTGKKNPAAYLKPKAESADKDTPPKDPATQIVPPTPPRDRTPLPPTADFRPKTEPAIVPKPFDPRDRPASPLFPEEAVPSGPIVKPPVAKPPAAPPANADDKPAEALASALVAARGDEFTRLLTELRDSKGSVYTQALVGACGRLGGIALERTREAFAIRLARMTPATLSSMLADTSIEVRLAAAKAVGLKSATPLANDLIPLIADRNRAVASAAVASLRKLSDRDFGPADDAGADERSEAIRAWKRWLAERK